jgi:hypothetical protein
MGKERYYLTCRKTSPATFVSLNIHPGASPPILVVLGSLSPPQIFHTLLPVVQDLRKGFFVFYQLELEGRYSARQIEPWSLFLLTSDIHLLSMTE